MKVRRVDFSPDEWLAGTVGLDNATRGLYITACALIYSHGGPIPEGELRRASCDHGLAYKRQLGCLISAGKLTENDGRITQERCENELRKARERSINGLRKAAKRWNNKAVEDAPALQPADAIHQPSTINSIPKEADAPLGKTARPARGAPQGRTYGPASRKTRIAPDWGPDLTDCRYAESLGWDSARIEEQADAFADRCRRDEPVYADWHAAWRTWCRNADKFGARRPAGVNGGGTPLANLFEGAWRAANELDEQAGDLGPDSSPSQPLLDRH